LKCVTPKLLPEQLLIVLFNNQVYNFKLITKGSWDTNQGGRSKIKQLYVLMLVQENKNSHTFAQQIEKHNG